MGAVFSTHDSQTIDKVITAFADRIENAGRAIERSNGPTRLAYMRVQSELYRVAEAAGLKQQVEDELWLRAGEPDDEPISEYATAEERE